MNTRYETGASLEKLVESADPALEALRHWGPGGLWDVWTTQRTFGGRHTGYAIVAGRKSPSGDGG